MRICIISSSKPHEGSGLGLTEYAYQLERHLKPLLSKNDRIDEVYALSQAQRNDMSGLIYVNTAFKKRIRSIPKDRYDIIHITDHEIGFAAKILKESGNMAQVVTTVHDLSRLKKTLHKGIAQKAYNKLVEGSISDAVKYSDFLLCNSTQTYDTVVETFGRKKNIKIVSHGTNDRIIKAPIPRKKKKGYFTIGYIGALMTHKNVIFILNAAKNLRGKDYRFVLYGTGVDMKMLQKFKEINSLDNLKLMGYLKEENKVKAYDSFDAFTFPSMYEGLGAPILEAKARGLPVILYKYGKIPKEVRKYCFEAESPEHMAQIIENLKEKTYSKVKMKAATKDVAKNFTWSNTAIGTLSVYNNLTNRKN